MITLKEIKQVEKACRGHFRAINKPGSFCASEPCPVCAAYSTMVQEAAKAGLDNLKSCPNWLVLAIAQREAYSGGRTAHYNGRWFQLDKEVP